MWVYSSPLTTSTCHLPKNTWFTTQLILLSPVVFAHHQPVSSMTKTNHIMTLPIQFSASGSSCPLHQFQLWLSAKFELSFHRFQLPLIVLATRISYHHLYKPPHYNLPSWPLVFTEKTFPRGFLAGILIPSTTPNILIIPSADWRVDLDFSYLGYLVLTGINRTARHLCCVFCCSTHGLHSRTHDLWKPGECNWELLWDASALEPSHWRLPMR